MRLLGIGATIVIVLSFILWFTGWTFWTFFVGSAGYDSVVTKLMQGVSVVGIVLEYLAVLLVSIGLIIAGKKAS